MAFDLTTARPVQQDTGEEIQQDRGQFDLRTARPVSPSPTPQAGTALDRLGAIRLAPFGPRLRELPRTILQAADLAAFGLIPNRLYEDLPPPQGAISRIGSGALQAGALLAGGPARVALGAERLAARALPRLAAQTFPAALARSAIYGGTLAGTSDLSRPGWIAPKAAIGAAGGAAFGVGGEILRRGIASAYPTVEQALMKAIRPGVSGQRTASQADQYLARAKTAVKTILNFRSELAFPDETGALVSRLPRTLKEFSQAIEQTKFAVFQRYNALATQAGKAGVRISTKSAEIAARNVAQTPVLQRYYPKIAAYANGWATRLRAAGSHTPEEVQDLIAKINADLDAYYRNPQPGHAAQSVIDAGIANNLRKGLDAAIESETGGQYQLLKNLYGSLKTIERDVNRRAVVFGRQNQKGLIDFSDIFSGAQIARGITSLNPSIFTSGVAAKLIAAAYKRMNNPDAMIERMFQRLLRARTVGRMARPP